MNKAQLTSKCHKISSITGLPFNSIMIYYFLESILQKFSQSNYKDNFIFKEVVWKIIRSLQLF